MKNRVFVIHGWDGYPEEGWFSWLKNELEKNDFEVIIPQMPDPANPRIFNWVPTLEKLVPDPDENTYFVGHSMGCQAIARYVEKLPNESRIGGVVFVAGFFKHLKGLENDPEVMETDRHWLASPIDFDKIKPKIGKSVAIFSDNDPWVPLDNQNDFRDKLGSKIIIEHEMGHFSGDDGVMELPSALDSFLEISK